MAGSSNSSGRWARILSTAFLVTLWLAFAAANLRVWLETHHPVGLGAITMELVVACVFLSRRQPFVVSRSPLAWVVAGVGTFGLLAARPAFGPVGGERTLYLCLQLCGAAGAIVSVLTLGRKFGVVAANRGIKTSGPYRLVRHPIYASYLLGLAGYLLENPSLRNAVVSATVIACQLFRITAEESCLSADPAYVEYRARVRYRLVPFVF